MSVLFSLHVLFPLYTICILFITQDKDLMGTGDAFSESGHLKIVLLLKCNLKRDYIDFPPPPYRSIQLSYRSIHIFRMKEN